MKITIKKVTDILEDELRFVAEVSIPTASQIIKNVTTRLENDLGITEAEKKIFCPKCKATENISLSALKDKAHCFKCDHYWEV